MNEPASRKSSEVSFRKAAMMDFWCRCHVVAHIYAELYESRRCRHPASNRPALPTIGPVGYNGLDSYCRYTEFFKVEHCHV